MAKRFKKFLIAILFVVLFVSMAGMVSSCSCGKKGKNVTITFETNGGTEIAPVTLKKGEKYTLPKPEKEGVVFYNWFYDDKFESECSKTISVQKSQTLYARYCAKLTFDCSGGTELSIRIYYEGEELGTLPVTYKEGFSFSGWYYDSDYNQIVNKKDVINKATTIYAKFSETAETLKKLTSVKNASVSPTIEIKTDDFVLHNDNVSDYFSFTSSSGEEISLTCRPSGNGLYIVEPNKKLAEGMTYSVKSLSNLAKIASVDGKDTESADEVTLTTKKEEKEEIVKKSTIRLTSANLAKWEENVYVYMDLGLEKDVNRIYARTNENIKVGSILTIGETAKEKDEDYICKVISVKKERLQYVIGTELKEDEFVIMDVVTPNVDDIYADLDIYGERQAELQGSISLSAETVAENVEKNQGIQVLKSSVKNAVLNSPTIKNYVDGLSSTVEQTLFMASLGSFEFKKPKVKIDINKTVLAFEIELGGEIQIKNIKISVSVTIKNSTSVDYSYTICKSGLITLNPLLWFYTDVRVDLSNDFSISLQASVEFTDAEEDVKGIIDITDEIEYVMDVGKDGQNKFAEAITGSSLWDDDGELEYVDIFSIPLGQIPLPVPVVSLQLDFNVVGSLGARAGLYVDFSHHYVETTTLTNGQTAKGENGKPVMFKEFKFNRATTENEITLSITLKGQVGFRCGLEAKLSLSVLRLNSVASVYVSFRFGPYIELSGLVNFRYSYDAVNKVSETHLYGGMYLDVGLFVNAKLGAKFLVYDLNTDIFDKKISLYGVGDRLIPLKFVEKENSPESPVVLTSRYGGVRMTPVQMVYLDIVTGEEVVDSALRNRYGTIFSYEFEFIDSPDYQTKDYEKYVTINGASTLISKKYPFKSLKFVVKAKLLPKHGVYASGIERIFYVEYRNPDGRDYAIQNSEFRNEYYAGGGSTYSEVLSFLSFKEGEQVIPPEYTLKNLPVRQGYYLDLNDLWEKYYPFLNGKVDEDFNGTFPIVTYENANVLYNGYMLVNTCYYRLKWKRCTYTAEFYYPEFSNADTISNNVKFFTAQMIYVPTIRGFIVLADSIEIPTIAGKTYSSFVSSSGLSYTNEYFVLTSGSEVLNDLDIKEGTYPIINVDVNSKLYLENFEGIKNGAKFYASYYDTTVYTETYVLETRTVKRVKTQYKSFDYVGKTIRPNPPAEFAIGSVFTENGNKYVIKGYRDINPENEQNSRYYDISFMPEVTKNRIYYLLYEREGYENWPVYYVNVVANGKKIGDYGIKQGEDVKIALIKANFSDETIISRLAGYPLSTVDSVIDEISVIWDETSIPAQMPSGDVVINVTATYSFKELTAEFILNNSLQSFASGVSFETRQNGDVVHVAKGKTWTFGSTDDTAYYSLPALNDYFDNQGKKYYSFYGWQNLSDEKLPYGIRIAFTKNEVYTPVFVEKTVIPTIVFTSVSDYGYEYSYKVLEGDYFGKTLASVIEAEKIANPERADANGIFEYEFSGWGVQTESYIIGNEKDLGGNVKTYIVFKAQFIESKKAYSATFNAMDGTFENGKNTLTINAVYGENVSGYAPKNYANEMGQFTFICWTTIPYSLDNKVEESELIMGNSDVTYYAYYSLNPATITLTFKGKVKTESSDGTGVVYFKGDKSVTEFVVTGLYGKSFYITANDFKVDSLSKTFVPDYLRWEVDGKEYTSVFYNDGYMANVPFDNNATIEIYFKEATPKIVNIAFVSDGECFELDGTKINGVICNGYMTGFRHVINYYEKYGDKIVAPYVDFYSENYYRFDRWEAKTENGSQIISVKAGEEITFTSDLVFYAVYVHDTTESVKLTFRAETKESVSETGNVYGIMTFADGSVEIVDNGVSGEKISFNKIPTCQGKVFVGWTTDGTDLITQAELLETTYSSKTTYYAVYSISDQVFEVTLYAGNGTFAGATSEKTINAPFGKLATELDIPVSVSSELVFSHYENEDGYPVTVIEKSQKLYAKYAKPVSTAKDLININLAPNENYVLTQDIALGGNLFDEDNLVEWTAIGINAKNGFNGTFNGNGHKISITANSGTVQNFGLFYKVSGTVYNLSFMGFFSVSGNFDSTALGAFCGEVTSSGRIIDCHTFTRLDVAVTASQKISASGAIGVNNGLIDGLMASASGVINIDSNKIFNIGAVVGLNAGVMKNVHQSGMGGAITASFARRLNCNVGSFAGYNTGTIENSFSERAIMINFTQGDNVFLENSVVLGGFVGKNDGSIKNASALYGKIEFNVSNLTLFNKENLYLSYNDYDDTPCYIIYEVGKDNQGVTYTTQYVIYLDENAVKKGSTEYEEYTLSEFTSDHPVEAKKIISIRKALSFGSFVGENNGTTDNVTVIQNVNTGNGVELVSSCSFNGVKWNYLERLHRAIYNS